MSESQADRAEPGRVAPSAEQLELLHRRPARPPERAGAVAAELPVARVIVDVTPPHLDHEFDYLIPEKLSDAAQPGVRCTVRLAGRRVTGYVVDRRADSPHPSLQPLVAVSGVPVLTPEVLALARTVARDQAGTVSDVLRLAVPPRHASTEKSFLQQLQGSGSPAEDPDDFRPEAIAWQRFRGGQALLARIREGLAPRAVWHALPPEITPAGQREPRETDWASAIAEACVVAAEAGKGSIVVVPDHRDVQRVVARLSAVAGQAGLDPGVVAQLTADQGPAARYRAFLRVLYGQARIVVGTRAASWAPARDLGLVVCWDDGDDLHAEPRAPYPHTRDVLRLRAEQSAAAAIFGGFARSVEAHALVERGWARPVTADRPVVRISTARIAASGDDDARDPAARSARLPSLAIRLLREASTDGPVLVQVPHGGYVGAFVCQRCRQPARCGECEGPIIVPGGAHDPSCGWCGRRYGPDARPWRCRGCQGGQLRAVRVGSARTAEEIGRAVPGVPVKVSSADAGVSDEVGSRPLLVVATPGAEPPAAAGYAAAVLLDGWVPLARPELRAGEEAVRRWLHAAALVRPADAGGRVLVVADSGHPAVQALVRWDPAGFAERELAERIELGLPPAGVLAEAWGEGVPALLEAARMPEGVVQLGPEPDADGTPRVRWRAPAASATEVAVALGHARGSVSAGKRATAPRVRMRALL